MPRVRRNHGPTGTGPASKHTVTPAPPPPPRRGDTFNTGGGVNGPNNTTPVNTLPRAAVVVPPKLPTANGTGRLTPWGGPDPTRWRPEAIMANAASAALNEA